MCSSYFELGMIDESMEIALEGIKKFPEEDAILYQNVGATFFQKGWQKEATEVLKKGIEKFPEDEEIKKCLKDIEEDMDNPDGEKPPILGLILLMALISKRLRKRK
jgi:tetratricopeptide (TPR) repeat protein